MAWRDTGQRVVGIVEFGIKVETQLVCWPGGETEQRRLRVDGSKVRAAGCHVQRADTTDGCAHRASAAVRQGWQEGLHGKQIVVTRDLAILIAISDISTN